MDQTPMVEMLTDDGRRLVERLIEEGVGVTAACWLRETESGKWFLYIATPLVGDDGAKRQAIQRVSPVVRGMSQPFWISSSEVRVIGPSDPIADRVHELHRRYVGPRPIQLGEGRFGGMRVDGAYVYPPIHAAVH